MTGETTFYEHILSQTCRMDVSFVCPGSKISTYNAKNANNVYFNMLLLLVLKAALNFVETMILFF